MSASLTCGTKSEYGFGVSAILLSQLPLGVLLALTVPDRDRSSPQRWPRGAARADQRFGACRVSDEFPKTRSGCSPRFPRLCRPTLDWWTINCRSEFGGFT